jgi:hypothetical protein
MLHAQMAADTAGSPSRRDPYMTAGPYLI